MKGKEQVLTVTVLALPSTMNLHEWREYFHLDDDTDKNFKEFSVQLPKSFIFKWYDDHLINKFGECSFDNLIKFFDEHGWRYFGILHDRDKVTEYDVKEKPDYYKSSDIGNLKPAHYHFYIHMPRACKYDNFCKSTATKPNEILVPRGSEFSNLQYFLHWDKKSKEQEKFQYVMTDIISCLSIGELRQILHDGDDCSDLDIIEHLRYVAIGELSILDFFGMHPHLIYKASSMLSIIHEIRNENRGTKE